MCGRFTITVDLEEIAARYDMDVNDFPEGYRPNYNAAPSHNILAIISDGTKRRAGFLKWGLIPSWAKDPKIANQTFNARSETINEKPAFRTSFQRRRCIIPCDGIFEWKKTETGKQPMRIIMKSREIFSLAGIYDSWEGPDGKVSSFSIVTTIPNRLMAAIHDRMPVILKPGEDEETWLDRAQTDTSVLRSLLQPYAASEMHAYPVSPMVNKVQYNVPMLIDEDQPTQQSLF